MLLSFKEPKGKDGIFMVDLIEKNEVVQFKDGNDMIKVEKVKEQEFAIILIK